MNKTKIENELFAALENIEIIDCHEHLGPEKERIKSHVDAFTLFSHYIRWEIERAGMTYPQYQSLFDYNIPLAKRWDLFAPFWEQIRWGSYARAVLITIKEVYGFEEVTKQSIELISEAVQAANKPGIYQKVLRDMCKIRTALTCGQMEVDSDLLTPIRHMPMLWEKTTWDVLERPWFADRVVKQLDDYIEAVREYIINSKQNGAVGLKMISYPNEEPSRDKALAAFKSLQNGTESELPVTNPIRDYVIDEAISFATKNDLVIAVHTGYWGDFRMLHPLNMIPLLQRHPDARFDIFHLGFPWVRETLMLAKGFSNVWLNLCWTHIISQQMAVSALDEAIDLVPMNKILAFGGDYTVVEKVYGHLFMAKENIAHVLARRIQDKQMTETQALELAQKWFWDNPKHLYRLNCDKSGCNKAK